MRGGKVAIFNIEGDADSQADWTFEGIMAKHFKTKDRCM